MGSVINYADAVIWFSALAAWGVWHEKVRGWIKDKIAQPMFNTEPEKTTHYIYVGTAGILLFRAMSNVLSAKRQSTFESIAENMSANQFKEKVRDPK
jgi:hypothetical protein